MKKLILTALSVFALCATTFAQGTLTFNNSSSAYIYDAFTGSSPVRSSGNVIVQLYWNASTAPGTQISLSEGANAGTGSGWTSVTPTATTRTGSFAGLITGATLSLPGTTAGQTVTIQLLAWSSVYSTFAAAYQAGAVSISNPMTAQLGSTTTPGASLTTFGLQPMNVAAVPEPTTIALGLLGAGALLAVRRRK